MLSPPFRSLSTCSIDCRALDDGSILMENRTPLTAPLPDVVDRLDHWARQDADAVLVSEPSDNGRRTLRYGAAALRSSTLATRLTDAGLQCGDVVCVVAVAGCDHALVKLACLRAGLVHAPISPRLLHSDAGRARLASMLAVCRPALILIDDPNPSGIHAQARPFGAATMHLSKLAADACAAATAAGHRAHAGAGRDLDETAAIYFTSGSTGEAKGVIVTRRMISAVHCAGATHWPLLARRRPVMMDWLPWHHVFGGLDNFFKMVWNGGACHIRAVPGLGTFEDTVKLAAAVNPTFHVDVPLGLGLLLDRLERDASFRAAFFARLELVFFAGAGLDEKTWKRLKRITRRFADDIQPSLRIASGYGCTEAGSTICLAHREPDRPDEIGVPLPGHALRLVDVEGRTEIRVRGPSVSPGYLGISGRIPMPLDDEGFLRTGDTVAASTPHHPEYGLRFDGRLAEDFKLSSGTWVKVDRLRRALVAACAPHIADVAIAGEARDSLRALLFPSREAARLGGKRLAELCEQALARHNARQPASSTAIPRAMIMPEPPDPAAGEMNDKGHLVQRRCLSNRRGEVERLYSEPVDSPIVVAHWT